jgi:uncharacterized membrane protein YgdD (TMEM256/DUF423 family)
MNNKSALIGAGLVLLSAVALGAFGAHSLETKITTASIETYKTGVDYQFYHGLGIIGLILIGQVFKLNLKWAVRFLFYGIILFSGSLYVLSIHPLFIEQGFSKIIGPITPIGGLCFIVGWILFLIKSLKLSK